jgi:hypothetical protein
VQSLTYAARNCADRIVLTKDDTPPDGGAVKAPRYGRPVDVIAEARRRGFELEERMLHDQWMWGWRRDDDDERWPCFLEHRLAISWMRDRLGSGVIA